MGRFIYFRFLMACRSTYLEESIPFLGFELVETEETDTACSFFAIKALVVALEECEHIIDDNGFQVDLFLVVEILCL